MTEAMTKSGQSRERPIARAELCRHVCHHPPVTCWLRSAYQRSLSPSTYLVRDTTRPGNCSPTCLNKSLSLFRVLCVYMYALGLISTQPFGAETEKPQPREAKRSEAPEAQRKPRERKRGREKQRRSSKEKVFRERRKTEEEREIHIVNDDWRVGFAAGIQISPDGRRACEPLLVQEVCGSASCCSYHQRNRSLQV